MAASNELGRVHVITGPGKGKTTAAFGLALRAAGHGLRVCIVQFMKSGEVTGELLAARKLPGIEVSQFGTGRFIGPGGPTEDDRARARDGLVFVEGVLKARGCDLLVLDEMNTAVHFGLLTAEQVLAVLGSRGEGVEVVLTGRDAPAEFVRYADYVSDVGSVKHPYEKGTKARKGIEW